jgi:hypothetical protein
MESPQSEVPSRSGPSERDRLLSGRGIDDLEVAARAPEAPLQPDEELVVVALC